MEFVENLERRLIKINLYAGEIYIIKVCGGKKQNKLV